MRSFTPRRHRSAAFVSTFVIAMTLAPLLALADGPPAPPEEAYTACASLKSGDACTVSFHDHTIEGACSQRGDDTRLSCRPNHRPGPPPR